MRSSEATHCFSPLSMCPMILRISHIDLAIPALSLTRIDAFARRHGLTQTALFVQAVNRWAMQETVPRDRRGSALDGSITQRSLSGDDLCRPAPLTKRPIATT